MQSLVDAAPAGGTVNAPACAYHERLVIDKPLTVNGYGSTIYGDPNVLAEWIWIASSDVTVNGFAARDAGTNVGCQQGWGGIQTGGYWVGAVNNVTLRDLDLEHAGCNVVNFQGGNGHQLLNSVIEYGGQAGLVGSGGSSWTISGNRFAYNNTSHLDVGDTASGMKLLGIDGLTVSYNEVDHNYARGIWTDTMVQHATISQNRVHHNDYNGIFLESSHYLTVTYNSVWDNTRAPVAKPWMWGGGITLSSSDNADVHDNTVAWNGQGITVISQSRTDDHLHVNQNVHQNTIVQDFTDYGLAWGDDISSTSGSGNTPGILFAPSSNNGGSLNRYWYPGEGKFAWDGDYTTLAAFNATPGEEGGTYMTQAERDQALNASGIPLAP